MWLREYHSESIHIYVDRDRYITPDRYINCVYIWTKDSLHFKQTFCAKNDSKVKPKKQSGFTQFQVSDFSMKRVDLVYWNQSQPNPFTFGFLRYFRFRPKKFYYEYCIWSVAKRESPLHSNPSIFICSIVLTSYNKFSVMVIDRQVVCGCSYRE